MLVRQRHWERARPARLAVRHRLSPTRPSTRRATGTHPPAPRVWPCPRPWSSILISRLSSRPTSPRRQVRRRVRRPRQLVSPWPRSTAATATARSSRHSASWALGFSPGPARTVSQQARTVQHHHHSKTRLKTSLHTFTSFKFILTLSHSHLIGSFGFSVSRVFWASWSLHDMHTCCFTLR